MSGVLAALVSGASGALLHEALASLRPKSWTALLPALGLARTFDAGLAAKLAQAMGLDWDADTTLPPTEVVPASVPTGAAARFTLRPEAAAEAQEALTGPVHPPWLERAASLLWTDAVQRASLDPRAKLEALRFNALVNPITASLELDRMAHEADARCDVARLDALLGTLAEDERRGWLDPALCAKLQHWRRRAAARGATLDAWDRTTFYQDRNTYTPTDPPQDSHLAKTLLDPAGPPLQALVAGGGLGKTTFLRWLAARKLAVADPPVPVAWIDFDHVDPLAATTRRDLLACLVAASLARWFPDGGFGHLAQEAGASARQPQSAGASFLPRLGSELGSALGKGSLLILLDTTELVLNAPAADLGGMIRNLLELRAMAPGLRVLLAGRQWPEGTLALDLTEAQRHRLLPLPEETARHYLTARGVAAEGPLADAIIAAAGGVPFHLGLCVDIVQGAPPDSPPDPEEFRRGPELTYLLERVIRRLRRPDAPDQPDNVLQWIVFYAAAPRRVTPGYVEHVALPVLHARGTPAFSAERPAGFADAPSPDPLRDTAPLVWSRLAAYAATVDFLAREPDLSTGWLRHGSSADTLVLHDRVREPMRVLLRERYPLARQLHERAVRYWQGQAAQAGRLGQTDRWAEATSELIYHRLQGPASTALAAALERILRRTEAQQPPEAWARVAAEFRHADYRWGGPGWLGPFDGPDAARLCFTAAVSEARAWLQALGEAGGPERDAAARRGLREALQAAMAADAALATFLHVPDKTLAGPRRLQLMTLLENATLAVHEPDLQQQAQRVIASVSLTGRITPADRANLLLLAAESAVTVSRYDAATDLARRAAALNAGGNLYIQHRDDVRLSQIYMRLGKAGSALRPASRAWSRAERLGRPLQAAEALLVVGWGELAHSDLARVGTVLDHLELAIAQHRLADPGWPSVYSRRLRLWAELLFVTRRHAELLQAFGLSGQLNASTIGEGAQSRLEGLIAAERGDIAGAVEFLTGAASQFHTAGDPAAAAECTLHATLIAPAWLCGTSLSPLGPDIGLIQAALTDQAGIGPAIDWTQTGAASSPIGPRRYTSELVLAAALDLVAQAGPAGAQALPERAVDHVLRALHRLPLGVSLPILRWTLPLVHAMPPAVATGLAAFTRRLSLTPDNPAFPAHAPVAALITRFATLPGLPPDLVRIAVEAGFHIAQPEAMLALMPARADLRGIPNGAFVQWADAYVEAVGLAVLVPGFTKFVMVPTLSPAKALAFARAVNKRAMASTGARRLWRELLRRESWASAKAFIGALRGLGGWLASGDGFPESSLRAIANGEGEYLPIIAASILALYQGRLPTGIAPTLFPATTVRRLEAEQAALRGQAPEQTAPPSTMQLREAPPTPYLILPQRQREALLREVFFERGRLRFRGADTEGNGQVWEDNPAWLVRGQPNQVPVTAAIELADAPWDRIADLAQVLDLPSNRPVAVHLLANQVKLAALPWEAIALIVADVSVLRICPGKQVVRQRPAIGTTAILTLGDRAVQMERIWGSSGFVILPSTPDLSGYQASIAEAPTMMRVVVHLTGVLRGTSDDTGLPELLTDVSRAAPLSLRRLTALLGVSRSPPVLLVLDVEGPQTGAEGWLLLCRRNALAAALAQATGIPVAAIGPESAASLRLLAKVLQANTVLEEVPAAWAASTQSFLGLREGPVPKLPALFLPTPQ